MSKAKEGDRRAGGPDKTMSTEYCGAILTMKLEAAVPKENGNALYLLQHCKEEMSLSKDCSLKIPGHFMSEPLAMF